MKHIFYFNSLINKLLILVLIIKTSGLQAQVLETIQPFAATTPFLEPDGRKEVLKLKDNSFVSITKTKGNIGGDAEYVLEKYKGDLSSVFKTAISVPGNEERKEMFQSGNDLIVLSVIHDLDHKKSILKACWYDLATGEKKTDKNLHEFQVNPWLADRAKGAVKQSFESYTGVVIGQQFTTPVQYQYQISFSPDSSKVLAYIFDYSQKNLQATACIFDKDLNKLTEGIVHVDNNFVNYGFYINNGGEVIILNGDRLGRIVVVEYNLTNHENRFLDIQYTSARREGLRLYIADNDVVFVANIVSSATGKLFGVMYSKFNFKSHLVERINYHEISEGMKQTATHSRQAAKLHGDESWSNYEITHFIIDESEKITLAVEKREIQSSEFTYDHASTIDVDKWMQSTGRVNAEGILLFCFNKKDELLFEDYLAKLQETDINSGLNCASFVLDAGKDGKIRMLYTTSDNSSGIFNAIHYLEWDEETGKKLKDMLLPNPEGLGLLRNYSLWWPNKLIFAGRKGMMGKKSFICSYKLD